MKILALYSPAIVLLLWAAIIAAVGRSDALSIIGLLALAGALAVHIRQELNARRSS